jgi:hypothetical protein
MCFYKCSCAAQRRMDGRHGAGAGAGFVPAMDSARVVIRLIVSSSSHREQEKWGATNSTVCLSGHAVTVSTGTVRRPILRSRRSSLLCAYYLCWMVRRRVGCM